MSRLTILRVVVLPQPDGPDEDADASGRHGEREVLDRAGPWPLRRRRRVVALADVLELDRGAAAWSLGSACSAPMGGTLAHERRAPAPVRRPPEGAGGAGTRRGRSRSTTRSASPEEPRPRSTSARARSVAAEGGPVVARVVLRCLATWTQASAAWRPPSSAMASQAPSASSRRPSRVKRRARSMATAS